MADNQSFWQRMGKFVRPQGGSFTDGAHLRTDSKRQTKSKITPWAAKYELEQSEKNLDDLFLRLRSRVYAAEESGLGPGILPRAIRETGVMDPNRLYFFLKPFDQDGALFERSGAGWIISAANKIVAGDTFIRDAEPMDRVTVFRPVKGDGTIRITSPMLGLDKVSFSIYSQLIAEQISSIWKQN